MAAGAQPVLDTHRLTLSLIQSVISTVAHGTVGVNRGVVALGEALRLGDPAETEKVNQRIASVMHKATIEAVAEIEAKGSRNYREGRNRLPGGLGKAVRSADFVTAGPQGINFGNIAVMNQEAKHWARLNFGTIGRSPTPNGVFRLKFAGANVGPPIGLRTKPGKDPILPPGFFLHGSSKRRPSAEFKGAGTLNPFFPSKARLGSNDGPRKTVGIKATHFLDKGLAALVTEFPLAYTDYLQDQIARATKAGQAAVAAFPPK